MCVAGHLWCADKALIPERQEYLFQVYFGTVEILRANAPQSMAQCPICPRSPPH